MGVGVQDGVLFQFSKTSTWTFEANKDEEKMSTEHQYL